MKCYPWINETNAEPFAIALYFISVCIVGVSFYYLVFVPLQKNEATKPKVIKSVIFLVILLLILLFLPHIRENWLSFVKFCVKMRLRTEQSEILNITTEA
ncbi:hypothetical protein J4457_06110 [Candidatus Woesearchaeota archaeon]|nr:hypothetical protein [Candidatus Woesearchaeota archaeon]